AVGIHFQVDIIMEILSRLPVLSLLQFKCVSKFWKAFISDCYFKMKHLSHAKNDQNSQKFLTSQMCMDKDDMFNFYRSSLSSVQVVEDEQKLDCPSSCKPVNCMLFCCCDGLVLLAVCDRLVEHLLLWNPSTRESILLPHPESPLIDCVFGMGYDATSDDYKILTVNLNRIRPGISAEILALKSGSWRKNGKYPTGSHDVCGFMDCGTDSLAFVHGAFHWLGLSLYYTILSFDISNEVYGEIPLLERINGEDTTQKFNHISKGKNIVEPSNDDTYRRDVDLATATHVQEEVLMDILSRLPVQSLL
ncbi:f-boxkelch-repeat protein, partial [Nicotiana attenuata]